MAAARWFTSRWAVRAAVILGVAVTVLVLFGQDRGRTPINFHERDLIRRAEPEPPLLGWISAQASALAADSLQRGREGQLARLWVGAETWITRRTPLRREHLAAGLHAAATALFIALVWSLERERTLTLFSGILFAVHPAQAQAVIWTASRGILLAGTLLLGAALCISRVRLFIPRSRDEPGDEDDPGGIPLMARSLGLLAGAMVLYVLASLAAPVAVAALPLLLLVALRRLEVSRPLGLVLVLAVTAIVVFVFGQRPDHVSWWIGGAVRDLTHLFWPFGIGPSDAAGALATWIGVGILAILAAAALLAPIRPAFYAAWTLLGIAALRPPESVSASSVDLFLAVGGFAALTSLAARPAAQALSGRLGSLPRLAGPLVPAFLVAILATLCATRIGVFRDDLTFWRSAVRLAPRSWEAHYRLGLELQARGHLIGASEHYRAAIGLAPRASPAYTALGVVRELQGKPKEALNLYRNAARWNPEDYAAFRNLSLLYADLRRWDEADRAARQAVRLQPMSGEARSTLGAILMSQGAPGPAQAQLLEAIRLDPQYANAYFNLGVVYERRARPEDALRAFERAVALDPANVEARIHLEALRSGWRGPVRGAAKPRLGKDGS
jgi:tetratricopeptide (TPR) repeat protein